MMLLILVVSRIAELLILSRLLGSDSADYLSEAPVEKGAKSTEQERSVFLPQKRGCGKVY